MSIFSDEFQIKIIVLIAQKKLPGVLEFLKPEYFFIESLSWSFETIKRLLNQYPEIPFVTSTMLTNEEGKENKLKEWTEKSKNCFANVLQFLSLNSSFTDEAYLIDSVTQFIRKRELAYSLNKNSELIESGDWQGLQVSLSENYNSVFDIKKGLEPSFDLNNFSIAQSSPRIKTSFIPIDIYMGGLARKEALLIMGDSNVGKSMFIIWLGGRILRNGYTVLHVTLEMSREITTDRYFFSILDEDENFGYNRYRAITDLEGNFNEADLLRFDNLRDKYANIYQDKLTIYKGRNLGFTLADLRYLLNQRSYDAVIIDYLDIMESPIPIRDSATLRVGPSLLLAGLRDIAEEFNLTVITPTQANRQAVNKRILDQSMASEDYGKIRIADNVIGIGENQADLISNRKYFTIIKARTSQKGQIYSYNVDYDKMSFSFVQTETVRSQEETATNNRRIND